MEFLNLVKGAFVSLYDNKIKPTYDEYSGEDYLETLAEELSKKIKTPIEEAIKNYVLSPLDILKTFFETQFGFVKTFFEETILSSFSSLQTWIEDNFKNIEDALMDEIVGPLNEGINYIKQIPNYIKNEFDFVIDGIRSLEDIFVEFGNSIKQDIVDQVDNVRDDLVNIGDIITGSFYEVAENLESTFVSLGNTIYNGIDEIGDQLEVTFWGIFNTLISTFITLGDNLTSVFYTVFTVLIEIGLWLWECIQYIINCFTCVAYYGQKIFTSFCIIFYIFRLIMITIWGFCLAFFYLINKPNWAVIVMNGIYKANNFIIFITKPFYKGGIDIIEFFYPDECYDCGFSFSDFPSPPKF